MASGPLVGGGGGGDGSREKHRWSESKVYTRKSFNKSRLPKPSSPPPPSSSSAVDAAASAPPPPPPPQSSQTLATTTEDGTPSQPLRFDASDDNSSSPPAEAATVAATNPSLEAPPPPPMNGVVRPLFQRIENRVMVCPSSGSRQEIRDFQLQLSGELDQVRAFLRKIEAKEQLHLTTSVAGAAGGGGGYSQSQLSSTYAAPVTDSGSRRGNNHHHRQLSISLLPEPPEPIEKEKRTPKANQYYRNSEFLLGKDKIPPPETHKKHKSSSKKNKMEGGDYGLVVDKATVHAFKNCGALLSRLMKHKHGWVFNKPVDVKALGLHDYHIIIKHPMDLGTIKSRLSKNWYKSPREFAEDVRLTFRNAMTYNPKGQDVHVMAEVLSNIFEERWSQIEVEYENEVGLMMRRSAFPPPTHMPPPQDFRRTLDRSESMTAPPRVYAAPPMGRVSALKKPKAKDPHKRNMTLEEKTKLSFNLQALPPEKLEAIVQIIKKRNSSVSQHDDEIEVDIDQVDNETLWELDRFVTNYKKSLSKNKRKLEIAQARAEAGHKSHELNPVTVTVEAPKESRTDENKVPSSSPVREGNQVNNASRSSSSSSSSSDSGSSSSDSDSDSSSGYGSDTGQSPRS
ncbi:Transcription factor GTE4 [Acorus gramineus]|uniref:Transcription factor GTE4 n=1 Tax=Acorus gramineus TaxID=55184 RepID=A0AAV9BF67_ACOGR|nr:Transcription factor GTE4 [Acorus gramineus]